MMPVGVEEALAAARAELMYRREKQWQIFAWTTTVLVAVMGGAITLASKTYGLTGKGVIIYSWVQYGLMAVALAVTACCACTWIKANMKLENLAREVVIGHLKSHGITDETVPNPEDAVTFGYVTVLVIVTIGAIIIIGAPLIAGLWAGSSAS